MVTSSENDRRNDIGTKIILACYSSVVALLLALFINAAWGVAKEGSSKAELLSERTNSLEQRVSKLEVYYISFNEDFKEIKGLLKRYAPFQVKEGER